MLSAKQGSIKYHFLSLWYDSTWDWTQVSRAIGGTALLHWKNKISLRYRKQTKLNKNCVEGGLEEKSII